MSFEISDELFNNINFETQCDCGRELEDGVCKHCVKKHNEEMKRERKDRDKERARERRERRKEKYGQQK